MKVATHFTLKICEVQRVGPLLIAGHCCPVEDHFTPEQSQEHRLGRSLGGMQSL